MAGPKNVVGFLGKPVFPRQAKRKRFSWPATMVPTVFMLIMYLFVRPVLP